MAFDRPERPAAAGTGAVRLSAGEWRRRIRARRAIRAVPARRAARLRQTRAIGPGPMAAGWPHACLRCPAGTVPFPFTSPGRDARLALVTAAVDRALDAATACRGSRRPVHQAARDEAQAPSVRAQREMGIEVEGAGGKATPARQAIAQKRLLHAWIAEGPLSVRSLGTWRQSGPRLCRRAAGPRETCRATMRTGPRQARQRRQIRGSAAFPVFRHRGPISTWPARRRRAGPGPEASRPRRRGIPSRHWDW